MDIRLFGPIAVAGLVAAAVALSLASGDEGGEAAVRTGKGLAAVGATTSGGGFGGDLLVQKAGASGLAPIAQPVPVSGPDIALVPGASGLGGGVAFPSQAFPVLQQGQTGINVQGFGSATAPATSARLQLFVMGGEGFYPKPVPEPAPSGGDGTEPSTGEFQTLTEEDLAPIIDAIKAQGVPEADIEVSMNPGGYYDPYGPGRASITVTISDPGDRVQSIADAARDAASASGNLFLESVNVLYSVSPEVCVTLETESMQAAVEDARDRAQLLAQVLGVGIGDVVFASHYSYAPFGPSPCDPTALAYPEYYGGYYDPSLPAEATLTSTVAVTFAIP